MEKLLTEQEVQELDYPPDRYIRVGRHAGHTILAWPEDEKGVRHYGVRFTAARTKTIAEACSIAEEMT